MKAGSMGGFSQNGLDSFPPASLAVNIQKLPVVLVNRKRTLKTGNTFFGNQYLQKVSNK
jgi:hypothetical protein